MADDHERLSGEASAPRADGRSPVVDLIRRRPIGAFLIWFFTVGWLLSFLGLVLTLATKGRLGLREEPRLTAASA